jgi:hypothetical protein
MAVHQRWRRARVVVPLILLVMILMRLVWMQLRAYPESYGERAVATLDELSRIAQVDCGAVRAAPPPPRPLPDAGVGAPNLNAPPRPGPLSAWLASPAFAGWTLAVCESEPLDPRLLVRMNQWVFAATVLAAALMARFVAGSWILSLIVAAMLLSRGRLLTDIGTVSPDNLAMLTVTAFLATAAHFVRTGSRLSFAALLALCVLGALVDRSLLALTAGPPALVTLAMLSRKWRLPPPARWLRSSARAIPLPQSWTGVLAKRRAGVGGKVTGALRWVLGIDDAEGDAPPPPSESSRRGTLVRTLAEPFAAWVANERRWLRIAVISLVTGAFAAALVMLCYGYLVANGGTPVAARGVAFDTNQWLSRWLIWQRDRLDLHYALSLSAVALCAALPPAAGLPAFVENAWAAILTFLLLMVAACGHDLVDWSLVQGLRASADPALALTGDLYRLVPRPVLQWLEPSALGLGAASIYNLIKVLDARLAERG